MTKNEKIFTTIILGIIIIFGYFNLQKSLVLARDIQRKNDLKHIATAINSYLKEVGEYPPSSGGKIVACLKGEIFHPCEWGEDSLESTASAYIKPLPEDPLSPSLKYSYIYVSNTRNFQLFASLELEDDVEIKQAIIKRKLLCGVHICNFGVADSDSTSLDQELTTFEKQ